MKTIFTTAAKEEINRFREHQERRLIELIREKKFIVGDEELEVTASDIKDAAGHFRISRPAEIRRRKMASIRAALIL